MNFRINLRLLSLLFALITFSLQAQTVETKVDSTGLPGDHFSLEGALDLFKKAQSPEDFEKLLNEETNYVNNLDLNEDGDVDYIRVVDHMEGDVHALVLQVPFSEEESQDIAVIEIEKQGAEEAILQIVGDADIYGETTIVEPYGEDGVGEGKGPNAEIEIVRIVVNVWAWPSVRFVYGPRYRVYVSPYGWRSYPRAWKPWRPRSYRWHYARRSYYRPHYHVVRTHRVVRAHRVYTPVRRTSKVVHTRTTTRVAVNKKNKTVVRKTTTKTAAKGKRGNVAGKKTTTTTVKRKNGAKARKRTTTTKAKRRNDKATRKRTTTTKKRKRKG